MIKMRNSYKILVGKPEGKRPFSRPTHRWKENIKMDLGERSWEYEEQSHLTEDREQW
jgi:hypothetical protein